MGKRRFWGSMALGAILGGAVALLNKETRRYVQHSCTKARLTTKYYLNHPSEAVHTVRKNIKTVNDTVSQGATSTMNVLEQLEARLVKEAVEADIDTIKQLK